MDCCFLGRVRFKTQFVCDREICTWEPKVVQYSAPVVLCSFRSSCVVPWVACSWAAESGRLLKTGTSEPVAASKFISSTVGEQVSREYAKGWCHSKNTHSEVKHAPNHVTFVNILVFLPKLILFRHYFCYPLMVY